jgi:signal transduction histidine kinase
VNPLRLGGGAGLLPAVEQEGLIHLSIRARLLWLTLGLFVPLMILSGYNQWDSWNTSRTLLNDSIEQQAKLAATAFQQWIDAQQQTLFTISDLARAGSTNNAALQDYLDSIIKTRPNWLNVEIVSPAGEVLIAQKAKKWNLDAPPVQQLLSGAENGRPLVIGTRQISDKKLSLLSIGMRQPDGNILVARINGTSVSNVFDNLELPRDYIIALFDAEHQLIYRSEVSPEQLTVDVSQTPLLTGLDENDSGIIEVESPYDHVSRVYGLARVEPVDAVVAVGVPRAALYERPERKFREQLLLSLLIGGFAAFAAFLIAQGIVDPLKRLTAAALAFGEGDLSARSSLDDRPPVRELALTFNQMAEKIEAREEKLKELDQLKSDFVSSVSHELKTPLTTIKTLTRVLMRGGLSASEKQEYLETIGAECDRQIELVQNLLDLSRLESGAYSPMVEKTDTAEILRSAVAAQKHAAAARKLSLDFLLPAGELPPVKADPAALKRVISGLLENALKYTPEFGHVKVIAGAANDRVVIEVTDTGRGIASEDLERIFEKYYRGSPVSASAVGYGVVDDTSPAIDKVPGIGLGLYLVKSLVDQMNGKIEVKSPVVNGRGTAFAVSLPIYTGS